MMNYYFQPQEKELSIPRSDFYSVRSNSSPKTLYILMHCTLWYAAREKYFLHTKLYNIMGVFTFIYLTLVLYRCLLSGYYTTQHTNPSTDCSFGQDEANLLSYEVNSHYLKL